MRRIAKISCYLRIRSSECSIKMCRSIVTSALRNSPNLQMMEWDASKETIFHNLVRNQQKRGYTPATPTAATNECWNCKKHVDEMICKGCNHLQDVKSDINYFDLLNLPQTFALEASNLTKRFRQLQTVVHPDKFSNKSSREQTNSADWSSLINKAYKTLLIPIERGQYLLKLNGRQIPRDNSALNKEFLMEMMERNEEVDEANTKNDLDAIHERLSQELKEKVTNLENIFDRNDLEAATSVMVEMKYLLSIQKAIKNKLQSLMGT